MPDTHRQWLWCAVGDMPAPTCWLWLGVGAMPATHRLGFWSGVGDMPAPTGWGSGLVWCDMPATHRMCSVLLWVTCLTPTGCALVWCGLHASHPQAVLWFGVGDMPAPTRHDTSGRATASQLSPGPLGLSLAREYGCTLTPNQSSHLGIHKQRNDCWSIPRSLTVSYHFKISRRSAESGNYEA